MAVSGDSVILFFVILAGIFTQVLGVVLESAVAAYTGLAVWSIGMLIKVM